MEFLPGGILDFMNTNSYFIKIQIFIFSCIWFTLIFFLSKEFIFYDLKRFFTYHTTSGVVTQVFKKQAFIRPHRTSFYPEVTFFDGVSQVKKKAKTSGFYMWHVGDSVKLYYSSNGDVYAGNIIVNFIFDAFFVVIFYLPTILALKKLYKKFLKNRKK